MTPKSQSPQPDKISESDFIFWKNHPVTTGMIEAINGEIARLKEHTITPSMVMHKHKQAIYHLGYIEGLQQLAELRNAGYQKDYKEESNEDTQTSA